MSSKQFFRYVAFSKLEMSPRTLAPDAHSLAPPARAGVPRAQVPGVQVFVLLPLCPRACSSVRE
jgi:hypothetical protein